MPEAVRKFRHIIIGNSSGVAEIVQEILAFCASYGIQQILEIPVQFHYEIGSGYPAAASGAADFVDCRDLYLRHNHIETLRNVPFGRTVVEIVFHI